MQHLNLIPRAQLCEKLGVSRSTLKRWVKTRNFPNPIKASGREPIYDIDQVRDWVSEMEVRDD
ncbi:AlpA family phage regulatory protein [Alphaproteobacteria bacterium]|nr:AlpA family phage regulatory protein [Alphaproteobacteria bacterium]